MIYLANVIENLLKSLNKEKLEEFQKKAESGNLQDVLQKVDTAKAKEMISRLGLADKVSGEDISKVLEQIQQNPSVLETLKKKL